jgi:phage-related protein
VVLTNAFAKKTQKTPRSEIALADKRKKQYLKENQK